MRPLSVIMFDEQEWNSLYTRQCHLRKIHKLQLTDINYPSTAKCVILWNLKQTCQQHAWHFKNLKTEPTNWKLTGAKAKRLNLPRQLETVLILINKHFHLSLCQKCAFTPQVRFCPPPLAREKKNPHSKKKN